MLQKRRPDLAVLVSSGYSEAEAFRHFSGAQVAGFVQKPYTALRLAEKIRRTIGDGDAQQSG